MQPVNMLEAKSSLSRLVEAVEQGQGKIGVRSRFQAVTLRDTLAATVDCSSPQALGRRAGPRLNTRLKAGPARTACTPWRG